MNTNFEIIALTKNQLSDALEQNTYWQNKVVAMPKSKAVWILKNERIEPEDIVAVLALEAKEIIGYTLIVPDIIKTNSAETFKTNWIHIWWVNQKYNGEIISPFLFNKTVKLLNKNVLLNSYLENTTKFFSSGPFNIINKRTRFTVFFNLEPNILISRFPFFKYLKWAIALCNKTLVYGINFFNKKQANKRTANITYDYLNELDNETWDFIKVRCQDDFIVKSKNYINWHIDNTQYTQTPVAQKFKFSYSTTGFSANIFSYSVKIMDGDQLIGFLSYVVNGMEFNLKYLICKDVASEEICAAALMEHFFSSKASYIITDDAKLIPILKKEYKPVFVYQIEKKALAHKNLDLNFENITLTDRDGRFH